MISFSWTVGTVRRRWAQQCLCFPAGVLCSFSIGGLAPQETYSQSSMMLAVRSAQHRCIVKSGACQRTAERETAPQIHLWLHPHQQLLSGFKSRQQKAVSFVQPLECHECRSPFPASWSSPLGELVYFYPFQVCSLKPLLSSKTVSFHFQKG